MKLLDIKEAFQNLFSQAVSKGTVFDKESNWMPPVMQAIQDENSVVVSVSRGELVNIILTFPPDKCYNIMNSFIKREHDDAGFIRHRWDAVTLRDLPTKELVWIYETLYAFVDQEEAS